MSWGLITEDWRLKLLALGLAILMLGAVAFSQNPPTTRSLTIPLSYNVRPEIVLINPPNRITVTYSGLADAIDQVNEFNLVASVEAEQAQVGTAVKLNVNARTLLPSGVTVQQPPPIAVNIDTQQIVPVPLNVVAPVAAGWRITKALALCPAAQCTAVNFNGPVSWENNLTATATYPQTIGASTSGCNAVACVTESPNQPVVLKNSSGLLDLSSPRNQTVPAATLDITAVTLHVEAVAGVTASTVPVAIAPPLAPPPQAYQICGVSITPATVIVTGDPAVLGGMHFITLMGVDLSRSTSDATFELPIRYPRGTTGSVALANVVYSIVPAAQGCPGPGP